MNNTEIYKKRTHCAICDNTVENMHNIMSYGSVPLAGNFPSKDELNTEQKFPLNLLFCDKCALLQTDSIINAHTLFDDYRYMSSYGLTKHFTEVAEMYKERFSLDENSNILEVGSNDGVLLKPMIDIGLNPIGIDPATNICKAAEEKGCNVINDFFSEETAQKHFTNKKFDLIISNNCFAHIENVGGIVKAAKELLNDNGVFSVEVHYVKNLIEKNEYDNAYHEHLYYYSLTSINNLFEKNGMKVIDFQDIPVHNGSIRVMAMRKECVPFKFTPINIEQRLEDEKRIGLASLDYFEAFSENVKNSIEIIKNEVVKLKSEGCSIGAMGASGRANMLCNMAGFTTKEIDFIADESPERIGRYIAGQHIPIVSKEYLLENKPDYIFIFAWNFAKMIIQKLEGNGFKYIIPLPDFRIVTTKEELEHTVSL